MRIILAEDLHAELDTCVTDDLVDAVLTACDDRAAERARLRGGSLGGRFAHERLGCLIDALIADQLRGASDEAYDLVDRDEAELALRVGRERS